MSTAESTDKWACEHQNWTTEQWKKTNWSDISHFVTSCRWPGPGKETTPGCTAGKMQADVDRVMLWALTLLGNLGSCGSCGCYFNMYHLLNTAANQRHPFMETDGNKNSSRMVWGTLSLNPVAFLWHVLVLKVVLLTSWICESMP